MYNSHFGLREKPFKLVPNPDYLYLSKNHEIALAHLTYAVGQGDGFVVITGEVGTGKTTLCRNFLDRLDDKTESAYIFNPRLDSVELLTSICNEFGIRTNQTSLKQLLDVINGYLILKNREGCQVVLLIDEAQNLSVENLEMIRMLSNLETTRSKLVQIILVGQPELSDKLDSYELRQLSQRISLSAYLSPLNAGDTANYIHHRVHIAAQRSLNLFSPGACRLIYKYSNGIPRMINIASDRALLTAFSLEKRKVTTAVARIAIKELSSGGRVPKRTAYARGTMWAMAMIIAVVVAGVLFLNRGPIGDFLIPHGNSARQADMAADRNSPQRNETRVQLKTYKIQEDAPTTTPTAMHAIGSAKIPVPPPRRTGEALPPREPGNTLQGVLAPLGHEESRFSSVSRLLELWRQPRPNRAQLPDNVGDDDYFDIAAHQYGLRMYAVQSDWELVRHLNLPAIIPLEIGKTEQTVFAALERWDRDTIYLNIDGATTIDTNFKALLPFLKGTAYVYWKNTTGFDALITEGAPEKAVNTIKSLLRRAGYDQLAMDPIFDQQTRRAILDFQKRNRLIPDGLIGPLTKILLIKEANAVDYPKLNAQMERGGA